jgi:hypothetical protein
LVSGEGVANALEDALDVDHAALGDLHGLASLDRFEQALCEPLANGGLVAIAA